jgi:hypothetical protein
VYVHRRWSKGRASRWLAARPGRMLAWWAGVSLLGLAGAVGLVLGLPWWVGSAVLVSSLLNLAPDLPWMPRAFAAWRAERLRDT